VLYRLYRPADFPQLYAIEQLCFQPPFRFSRPTMQLLVTSPNSATWIAEEDRQMAGFAIAEWLMEGAQTVAYIQTLEVSPSHRKRGIATELLHRLEASATAARAQVLSLHVAESNASAIRLYQAHGFSLRGREEDYYAPGIAAFIYSKRLDETQENP
jgi:ribosomal protein S18 acetylase RimI-like enzyme